MKASYTSVNKQTALILYRLLSFASKNKSCWPHAKLMPRSLSFGLFFLTQYSTVVFVEMSAKMRSLDREVRGLRMEKEDIERVSVDFICFALFFPQSKYCI